MPLGFPIHFWSLLNFEFLAFLCKVRGGRNKQNKLNWVSKFAAKQKDENWQKSFRKEIFCIFPMLIHRNRKNESTKATKTSHTQVAKLSFNFVRYSDTLGCNSIWSSKIKIKVLWSKLRFGFRSPQVQRVPALRVFWDLEKNRVTWNSC